jgi:hypothetical protein
VLWAAPTVTVRSAHAVAAPARRWGRDLAGRCGRARRAVRSHRCHRTQLTIIGATLEAVGIGLVALDFWAPAVTSGLRWLRAWDVGARLRGYWLIGKKRTRVSASFTMPCESAGAITPKLTSPRVATFDEVSDRLQAISDRITTIEGENARAHERLGNEIVVREERLRAEVQAWTCPRLERGSPPAAAARSQRRSGPKAAPDETHSEPRRA